MLTGILVHMKQGGHRKAEAGFTVIETLIVLAVSSALLISAFALVGGRQAKTAFMTSINSVQEEIQQAINETTSGYHGLDFQCTASVGQVTHLTQGAGTPDGSCLFIGNVLQFGTGTSGLSLSQMGFYPLVGAVTSNTGAANMSILATNPVAVYPYSSGNWSTANSNLPITLDDGDTFASVTYGGSNTGAVAFLAGDQTGSFANANTDGQTPNFQQLWPYAVSGSTINQPVQTIANSITTARGSNLVPIPATTPVVICVASGSSNQLGRITIDAASLKVRLQVLTGASSC